MKSGNWSYMSDPIWSHLWSFNRIGVMAFVLVFCTFVFSQANGTLSTLGLHSDQHRAFTHFLSLCMLNHREKEWVQCTPGLFISNRRGVSCVCVTAIHHKRELNGASTNLEYSPFLPYWQMIVPSGAAADSRFWMDSDCHFLPYRECVAVDSVCILLQYTISWFWNRKHDWVGVYFDTFDTFILRCLPHWLSNGNYPINDP